ncbi:MAG TPA: envelope stress response membrane protein PspB [Permianibacter sp.]|nr:envelope stress response membrane protein PspB [Permianibacter sp.]
MQEFLGIAMIVLFGTLFGLVVPLWLLLHYWSKRRSNAAPSEEDQARLRRLAHQAERLQQRVGALEAILDAQSPGWRDRQERSPHG